ncbi:adenine nucleotide alpha hydrolase family protein [Paraburkholderia oxyphila]|nr:hypothetical protein [Paraburkholderia oxyphila]
MREAWQHRQREIAAELNVTTAFSAPEERERRIAFLAGCLRASGLRTLVLGISGGIDSATAGRLAQLAVTALRAEGYEARFIAMRLPYGTQRDEADAAEALAFIAPDETLSADVAPPADLETLRPLRSDEDAYGVSYEEIDDFLEGKPLSDFAYSTILRFYDTTRHKRALPCTPCNPVPAKAGEQQRIGGAGS